MTGYGTWPSVSSIYDSNHQRNILSRIATGRCERGTDSQHFQFVAHCQVFLHNVDVWIFRRNIGAKLLIEFTSVTSQPLFNHKYCIPADMSSINF
jgi:hypothetical protein